MSDSFVFSKTYPNNSIVNPDVDSDSYLDYENPYTFIDFISNIEGAYNPKDINNLYLEYLKDWNLKKNVIKSNISDAIRDRYIEFLKDITLKFTTADEKRFLSNLDFNDELDIDIIIPFYSKKISEICEYYSQRRDKLKFKIEKNKIKTTSSSVEKEVYEKVTDSVYLNVIETDYYKNSLNYKELLGNFKIEVEELYDLYDNYFDNDVSLSPETYDRNSENYSENLNEIDINVFIDFDKAIAAEIFRSVNVFLIEFGKLFTINYDINSVDLNCKPEDKIYTIVTENKDKAKARVTVKKDLIQEFIGNNVHYYKTVESLENYASGGVLDVDEPNMQNILNTRFTTTATTQETSNLYSERKIGGFFTPHKMGILYFTSSSQKFILNIDKVEIGKTYEFPDPRMYGNITGLTNNYYPDYPLLHIEDYSASIKNYSNFFVDGDIKNTPHRQDYHGYYSKNQIKESKVMGYEGLDFSFSPIYNKGILTVYKTDIFGNEYGLFKNRKRKSFIDNENEEPLRTCLTEIYDGGPITFSDRTLLPEQAYIVSPRWVKPTIWASNYYYNIGIEGGLAKSAYPNLMQRPLYEIILFDALSTTYGSEDGDVWINPTGSFIEPVIYDGTTYPESQSTYDIINNLDSLTYDYILDSGGLTDYYSNINNIFDKTLDGNPKNKYDAPDFALTYKNDLKRKDFDAGSFDISEEDAEIVEQLYDFNHQTKPIITNQVQSRKTRLLSTDSEQDYISNCELHNSYGQILLRNNVTHKIGNILSALDVQFYNYPEEIKSEIYDKVSDFQIINDFISIRTKNYLIFEKIKYYIDSFEFSGTSNNYTTCIKTENREFREICSDAFMFHDRDYCMYAMLSVYKIQKVLTPQQVENSIYIIPTIKKVDYNSCETNVINRLTTNIGAFKLNLYSSENTEILSIEKPVLFYNTRNDRYGLVATINDMNGNSSIFVYKFRYNEYRIHSETTSFYYNSNVDVKNVINYNISNQLSVGSPTIEKPINTTIISIA